MSPAWCFVRRPRGQKTRDSLAGEFFATSVIRDAADSLIREGIQNALDAGKRNGEGRLEDPVRVHIGLHLGPNSLKAARHHPLFEGIWPHLLAQGNGLDKLETPKSTDDCPFLVFEDFNTTGLIGDDTADRVVEGTKNPFFHFFRAEGRSAKSGEERGRWGVGKGVFPRASLIATIVGYTKRSDDGRTLMMGATTLRSHTVGDIDYLPDGLYGELQPDGFVLPVSDSAVLEQFHDAFSLQRSSESGLSLVVPWIDPAVTKKDLVNAVVRGYFVPLLDGSLIVTISDCDTTTVLNAETFAKEAGDLGDDETKKLAALANWGLFTKPADHLELGRHPSNKPEWHDLMLADGKIEQLRSLLSGKDHRAAVRVPIRVRLKNADPKWATFRIFLEEERQADGRPVFVRDGILIPDVRASRDAGTRSLVIIEEESLSDLLGNAENPAHTQWQKDSSNFKGKYDYGEACLRFVSQSVHEMLARLQEKDDQGDPWLLADVFFLDEQEGDLEKTATPKPDGISKKKSDDPKPKVPVSNPKFYRIQSYKGGFSILPGPIEPPFWPQRLSVSIAYDVRKGNPFRKYVADDFRVLQGAVRIEGKEQGIRIIKAEDNLLDLEVRSPSFGLTMTGFDTKRDLIVKVREEVAGND